MTGILLADMSNLTFATCLDYHARTRETFDMALVRNLVLDKLATEKKRLSKYGDVVLCFDGKRYWRRNAFPLYKGKRAEVREKDSFDWNAFFPMYSQLKIELAENFPYKSLEVEGAEADDIIGTICKVYGPHRDICILSSDKDFLQVQQNICDRVKQWSIFHKKFLTPQNTKYDLFEHIVRGDDGDGIPNILSDDDTFMVQGKRQKPIRKDKLAQWEKFGLAQPEKFCATFETLEKFKRNQNLIDLRCIPDDLTSKIVDAYNEAEPVHGRVFNYCVKNRLTRILENGGF